MAALKEDVSSQWVKIGILRLLLNHHQERMILLEKVRLRIRRKLVVVVAALAVVAVMESAPLERVCPDTAVAPV